MPLGKKSKLAGSFSDKKNKNRITPLTLLLYSSKQVTLLKPDLMDRGDIAMCIKDWVPRLEERSKINIFKTDKQAKKENLLTVQGFLLGQLIFIGSDYSERSG